MKNFLMPIPLLFMAACTVSRPAMELPAPAPPPVEYRPFKSWCDAWERLDDPLRSYSLAELCRGVPTEIDASLSNWGHPERALRPHLGDLFREVLRRSRRDVLLRLLRDREVEAYVYREIAALLAEQGDPDVFAIVMADSVPEEVQEFEWRDPAPEYRHAAAKVLRVYLESLTHRNEVTERFIELLGGDTHSWIRGTAAAALGDSDDPDALRALWERIDDEGSTEPLNSSPEQIWVGYWARNSVRRIQERKHGKPVDP